MSDSRTGPGDERYPHTPDDEWAPEDASPGRRIPREPRPDERLPGEPVARTGPSGTAATRGGPRADDWTPEDDHTGAAGAGVPERAMRADAPAGPPAGGRAGARTGAEGLRPGTESLAAGAEGSGAGTRQSGAGGSGAASAATRGGPRADDWTPEDDHTGAAGAGVPERAMRADAPAGPPAGGRAGARTGAEGLRPGTESLAAGAEGSGAGTRQSGAGGSGAARGAGVSEDGTMPDDGLGAPYSGDVSGREASTTESRAADAWPAAPGTPGTGSRGVGESDAPSGTGSPLLPREETDRWEQRMRQVAVGFVDEPREAVAEADHALEEIATRFTEAVSRRRRTLRMSWEGTEDRGPGAETDTEQLRLALRDYRELAGRLLHL